jgi:hypothetical protein
MNQKESLGGGSSEVKKNPEKLTRQDIFDFLAEHNLDYAVEENENPSENNFKIIINLPESALEERRAKEARSVLSDAIYSSYEEEHIRPVWRKIAWSANLAVDVGFDGDGGKYTIKVSRKKKK